MVNHDFKQLSQFWTDHIQTILLVVHTISLLCHNWKRLLFNSKADVLVTTSFVVLKIQKVPGGQGRAENFFFPLYYLLLIWCSSFWIKQGRSCHLIGNMWAAPVQWAASGHWLIISPIPSDRKHIDQQYVTKMWTKSLFFFLWPMVWTGSTDTMLRIPWSKAGEVGRAFGKGSKYGFCCC